MLSLPVLIHTHYNREKQKLEANSSVARHWDKVRTAIHPVFISFQTL
jgi:hypothetical protein